MLIVPLLGATVGGAAAAQPPGGADLDVLLEKAATSYCDFMAEQNPKTMATDERGLNEGMALGFVMGPYPEPSDRLANMDDQAFEQGFYARIRAICPAKSFL